MITPFLYMVSTSFKPNLLAFEWPPRFIPDPATIDNYVTAWSANNFARYFANSVLDACATTFATTLLAALAAYAFARFTFPGRSLLFWAGYRHAHLIAPTPEYTDPLGQPISMATVRALCAALRRGGTPAARLRGGLRGGQARVAGVGAPGTAAARRNAVRTRRPSVHRGSIRPGVAMPLRR
jgi:hypothetical protein